MYKLPAYDFDYSTTTAAHVPSLKCLGSHSSSMWPPETGCDTLALMQYQPANDTPNRKLRGFMGTCYASNLWYVLHQPATHTRRLLLTQVVVDPVSELLLSQQAFHPVNGLASFEQHQSGQSRDFPL
mmetsp:Transcript_14397/g.31140  ORF Transcript_14397/g.31140 Transcript_14397/m.31140 type:complete len:127 (+) Transcript_14397:387-767(+)